MMRLIINKNNVYLEELNEEESFEYMLNILSCFLKQDVMLLFSFLEQNMDHNWHPNDLSMKKTIEQRKVFVSDE